jgi:hypothetical protein
MTQINELAGDFTVRVALPAQATANTDEGYAILRAEDDIEITGARIIFDAAITGAATNHVAFGLVNKGTNGAGSTAVTAVKAYDNGVNAAAFVPEPLTLSATEANRRLTAGQVLALDRTTPGTGLASPHGCVEVTYRLR